MKKKLGELNRKIRHSKKKNDRLIHKRNLLKKVIEELKRGTRQAPTERKQGFIECEQAFGGAYRSYRIDGRSRMDVDTFFSHTRGKLVSLIDRELTDLNSAMVQMTKWIRFIQELDDVVEINRAELAFNSRMTEVHQGSNLDGTVDGMIAHMKMQIENSALVNSRFRFDAVLFLDVNFHQLNLTRGSSYIPLPDWIAKKKAIVNPQNSDEECFKWSIIAAECFKEIKWNPERITNLKRFERHYDWSGLEFPIAINKIGIFERKNDVSITILALKGPDVYKSQNVKPQRTLNCSL